MSTTSTTPGACPATSHTAAAPSLWQRTPLLPLGLSLALMALVALPQAQASPGLSWSLLGTGLALVAWLLLLWAMAARRGVALQTECAALLRSHYVQAGVQLCIYAYWGWYWREVYAQIPLILAQLLFLYSFDAALSWSRGRRWRLGCGPLPIVLSTNVFIWFKPDWFAFQFVLIAVAALGKEFLRWTRDGRRTHIFNPSALALAVFAVVLLAIGGTDEYTFAGRIADRISEPPHIYVLIFVLGLVVQHFFSVTLMTLSAAAVLWLLNLAHHWATGTYYFIFSNLPLPIFLGLHLLMTDPSTSPRTNTGKFIFGALYGAASFVLYGALAYLGVSTVYDKLLPVPILNLSVQMIDRLSHSGLLGLLNTWETKFAPRRSNQAYMGCWALLFAGLWSTGYIGAPHKGNTYEFWREALQEGKPGAAKGLVEYMKSQARGGNALAWNELGLWHLEGELLELDRAKAVRFFAKASSLGSVPGAANLVSQFLYSDAVNVPRAVAFALDQLESACAGEAAGSMHYLVGLAYETGRGRPMDLARAFACYQEACRRSSPDACEALKKFMTTNLPASRR
jgi:hypothetical protein